MSDITAAIPDYDDPADMPKAVEVAANWVKEQLADTLAKTEQLVQQVEPDQIKRYAVAAGYAAAWTQGA